MVDVFRLDDQSADSKNPYIARPTRRPPGNVPYVVDNLWEWKRPANFPNRRYSVYASPTADLAKEAGGSWGGQVFKLEIAAENAKICQIDQWDAKVHPEVKSLPKLLNACLGDGWISGNLQEKQDIAALWAPCLSKDEVDQLFCSGRLKDLRETLWGSIKFWDDAHSLIRDQALNNSFGEIFIEAEEWRLIPLQ